MADINKILNSTTSGAAMGMPLGGVGAGVGAAVGLVGGIIAAEQQKRLIEDAKEKIKNMPDYRKSEAYLNAATQAGRADRYAQEGLTADQKALAQTGIERGVGNTLANAGNLQSGLMGMSANATSLGDMYTQLASVDAQQKVANRERAFAEQKNFQQAQDDAFSLDLAKQQNLLDLTLGEMKSDRLDSMATQQNIMTGVQGAVDSGVFFKNQPWLTDYLKDPNKADPNKYVNAKVKTGSTTAPNTFADFKINSLIDGTQFLGQ